MRAAMPGHSAKARPVNVKAKYKGKPDCRFCGSNQTFNLWKTDRTIVAYCWNCLRVKGYVMSPMDVTRANRSALEKKAMVYAASGVKQLDLPMVIPKKPHKHPVL